MKARMVCREGGLHGVAIGTLTLLTLGLAAPAAAQISAEWTPPRTSFGHPDLQGNWTNGTMTPIDRPPGLGPVLTPEQVEMLVDGRQDFIQEALQASDPDRDLPPVGGEVTGDALFDAATGGTGGYNYFFVDAGDDVAVYDGEPRSSLLVEPSNGQLPPFTEAGARLVAEQAAFVARFGEYDNPENRPLAERCVVSFGTNAGPPMTPNYFYNNNYTIVQTPTHVMIMTEMVHDVRIIRLGEPDPLPDHMRPWFGDSWGRWDGNTLVVETTNLHPDQVLFAMSGAQFRPSEEVRVTERFTRADETTINYEFTVEDPIMFDERIRGEIPFKALDGLLYEYACHEANYALENVLRGARAEEARGGPGGNP
ncbi:MAG TPA: hypothetical protein VJ925_11755 [Longimicrobiales bacterium]|nr:hypothetical protein [Longimicrobiales bacterium]